MASATLSPYKSSAGTQAFVLTSTSATGARYQVSGREIACPYVVEIQRKLTASGASTNDHVTVRIARTERNATTSKLATCQALLDISIPKDQSIIGATMQKEILSVLASLLNESTVMEATTVAMTALIEGRDL